MRKGKGLNKTIGTKSLQEPPTLRSVVARAIRQTASREATSPDASAEEVFKTGKTALDRITKYVWQSGKLARNGEMDVLHVHPIFYER